MSLLDAVQEHLGQNEIGQIAQQLGVSPAQAQTAVSTALPMMLGGMAGHAAQPEGQATIQQAVSAHQDAAGNVSQLLQAGPPADQGGAAGGLLGRVLGSHRDTVQQGVQQASGLDSDKTRKLLMMLAPVVLGILARRHFGSAGGSASASAPDAGQLRDELQNAAQSAAKQSPHMGGLLGKIMNAVETPRA